MRAGLVARAALGAVGVLQVAAHGQGQGAPQRPPPREPRCRFESHHLRQAGLELVEQRPFVRCGRPGSTTWQWADDFFPPYSHKMENLGLLTPEEGKQFRMEWEERSEDPDACFYSPIIVGFAGRRP